jgi:hypothetical protein
MMSWQQKIVPKYLYFVSIVVFWNFISPTEEQVWMNQHLLSKDFAGISYDEDATENAADKMAYTYNFNAPKEADGPPRSPPMQFKGNVVQLSTCESGERLAVSFAVFRALSCLFMNGDYSGPLNEMHIFPNNWP